MTREATLRLLKQGLRPTCILMPDDYAALGGMEAVRACGCLLYTSFCIAALQKKKHLQKKKMIDVPCETCYNFFRWLC